MIIEQWLKQAQEKLEKADIGTARLDAFVLLEDSTGKDRAWLLANPQEELAGELVSELAGNLKRRAKHEPLSYIRGKTEFYKREFVINKSVLEPRPESETMIDLLKQINEQKTMNNEQTIVDIGTGSGALAVTVKLELPKIKIIATDIDPSCLKVSKQNAKKHNVDVKFYIGDLLAPTYNLQPTTYNLILANLPYVPDDFTINQAAMNEPKIAIFGGHDGLDIYRMLFKQIVSLSQKPQYILTESLPFQHKKLQSIAKKASYQLQTIDDFIQLFTLKS